MISICCKKLKRCHIAVLFVLFITVELCSNRPCQARVYIDINAPYLRKIPTAIPIFKDMAAKQKQAQLAKMLSDLLAETIKFTGFFKILDRESFLEDPQQAGLLQHTINFKNWTDVGAELLIKGGFQYQEDVLKIELRLFDTFGGRLIVGKRYTGRLKDHRRMIHRFCDEVILRLTGHPGIFNTRIAFVSTTTGNKEIFIADFDGYNPIQFTNTGTITLFPAWSSDGKWLAYTDYRRRKPELYIRNIKEQRGTVVALEGSSITPAWVPGQFALAASLSYEGNPAIYLLSGNGKIMRKLTHYWGIDVAPTWSPDGKAFAFVSNRSGTPQIFIKSMENGEVRRLTYEGDYNSSPQWSPRGNDIAYVGLKNGHLDIYLIGVNGNGPIQLTREAGDNESPTWSPDGSLIAFSSTREGPSRIYVMNANGTNQRRLLLLEGEQTNPSWSPRVSGD
ncbi:MAG: Tol-Pal system beta propeller repeat protein TolB [Deltaproteobacteria bacterium]|nr:Tol-Pal system beta propeller repeat protein TolB [Deltaproteobacteria bacterium]MBW2073912.1 Tol-Pal system beta propeller repeat protein TolB [Deltaproteobacteria bacterium]